MALGHNDRLESLGRRAGSLRLLLLAFAAIALTSMIGGAIYFYYEVTLPYSIAYSIRFDGDWLLPAGLALWSLGLLGAFIASLLVALALAMWVNRAWSNLHDLGLDGLNYTPGWATGSIFVPIINLSVPFRAMRELANRSSGEDAWQAQAPVADVSSWWSALLAGVFLRLLLGYAALVEAVPYLHFVAPRGVNTGLHLFSMSLLLASALFLYRAVGMITRYQQSSSHVSQAFA